MNTKKRLNCYVFSNLIISLLSLNIITNNEKTLLVEKTSNNTLNKIYEKEVIESISIPDTIISSENNTTVVSISNKSVQSENKVKVSYTKPSYNSITGTNLVNYARNFLGLRYVSAGNSLSTGTDCSGFTRLIYGEFGISLGRTVSSQVYSGTYVSRDDLQPGDLVFYSYGNVASHVAIYMGNGLIIHESNPRDGVKISSVNIMNYITARRLITSNVVSTTSTEKEIKEEVKPEAKEEIKQDEIKKVEVKEEVKEKVVEEVKEEKNDEKIIKETNQNNEISETKIKESTSDQEIIVENNSKEQIVNKVVESIDVIEENNNQEN